MLFARRGHALALLVWPAALIYGVYNYLAYVFALPPGAAFVISLLALTFGLHALLAFIWAVDPQAVRVRPSKGPPPRWVGLVPLLLGLGFMARVLVLVGPAVVGEAGPERVELAVLVADFVFAPICVIGGALLLARRPSGLAVGGVALTQLALLFVGVVLFMLLGPLVVGTPLALVDVLVVAAMGLPCFVALARLIAAMDRECSLSSPS
jgi:hypothetical protein